ncbi:MAG: hypothetical protein ACNYVW_05535 [Methanosarcinales archaeon]
MSLQDNESEAEQKPPDSLSLRKETSTSVNMVNRVYLGGSSGGDRGRYEIGHEITTTGYAEERLDESSQSCFFILPQLLRCV